MRKIEKHSFEAVSLLTVDNGLLDITIIPTIGQPDWVIPSNLILSVDEYSERIWTYLWHSQEVVVHQLLPRDETPEKIIVLEGNTDVHRVGLLVKGTLIQKQVSISDVKDAELPEGFVAANNHGDETTESQEMDADLASPNTPVTDVENNLSNEDVDSKILPYAFQAVEIDNNVYLVPDLDTLAHQLVDLDSY